MHYNAKVPVSLSHTQAVGAALSLAEHGPGAGHRRAGLREAADGSIQTHATGAHVGLPRLGRQKDVTLLIAAVAGHAVVAWRLWCHRLLCDWVGEIKVGGHSLDNTQWENMAL